MSYLVTTPPVSRARSRLPRGAVVSSRLVAAVALAAVASPGARREAQVRWREQAHSTAVAVAQAQAEAMAARAVRRRERTRVKRAGRRREAAAGARTLPCARWSRPITPTSSKSSSRASRGQLRNAPIEWRRRLAASAACSFNRPIRSPSNICRMSAMVGSKPTAAWPAAPPSVRPLASEPARWTRNRHSAGAASLPKARLTELFIARVPVAAPLRDF